MVLLVQNITETVTFFAVLYAMRVIPNSKVFRIYTNIAKNIHEQSQAFLHFICLLCYRNEIIHLAHSHAKVRKKFFAANNSIPFTSM